MKRFGLLSSWVCFFRAKTAELAASRCGAAAVEFAILIPVIATGLLGVGNYGLVVFEKMELVSAARAGAQQAMVNGADTASIKAVVVASTNLNITTTNVAVADVCWCADTAAGTAWTCGVSCTDGGDAQHYTEVTVSEDYALLLLGTTLSLSESVRIRTE